MLPLIVVLSHLSVASDSPDLTSVRPEYRAIVSRLQKQMPKLLAEHSVPGAAVALVDDQEIAWVGGFGSTDRTGKRPVTADTLFSLQSITKTYTATAFLIAASQGRITLDEPLKKALPGFTVHSRWGDGEADNISFRHLLSHYAGLCHEAPVGNNYGEWHCPFDEHVRSIGNTWLKCRVGERFRYSNLGFDLVGYALQRRLEKPFPRLMREELFAPLGMTASTLDQTEALADANRARGHVGTSEVPPLEIPMLAAGGMYASARDMAKFVSFHLAGGCVKGRRLVVSEALRAMYTPQFVVAGQTAGYGLGVNARPYHGATLLFHGGGGYGYATDQRWVPEHKVGVVVLTNGEGGDNFVADVADQVLQEMIRAKTGSLALDKPLPGVGETVINPEPEILRPLEGTYIISSQTITFRANAGRLHLIRGKRDQILDAYSPTRFGGAGQTYEFVTDERGKVPEVRNAGDNGVSVFVRNDSLEDAPGRFRSEWDRYVGDYRARAYGLEDVKSVTRKNGYLYWNDRLKLTEYRENLFFTADGDAVEFGRDSVDYGNRHFHRVRKAQPGRVNIPGKSWQAIDRPEDVGWSADKLERALAYADFIDTAALMVIVDGRVLCSRGDTSAKFMAHSMRKSHLSALFGTYAKEGRLALDKTLAELNIDDTPPALTPGEKRATVRDLLKARSGIYHPAALETADMALIRPARGSHPPGTHWYYNNWDFNALGTIFEQETGQKIFEAYRMRIAEPLGMEDFRVADGVYQRGDESRHPGYPFRMTARDLARFGLLYLRKGAWNGRQVVPQDWVEESTRSYSDAGTCGYGYMWWVAADGKSLPGVYLPDGSFWAWGTRGHYLLVVPDYDLVVAHRVDTDVPGREVSHKEFGRLLRLLLDARQ
jgi:CubicO group peptidase (beta-lactamase class C family)